MENTYCTFDIPLTILYCISMEAYNNNKILFFFGITVINQNHLQSSLRKEAIMVSFNDILDMTTEFYEGLRIGFEHNYWILKNKVFRKRIRKNGLKQSIKGLDIETVKHESGDVQGLKVVGVGFGRTGTFSLGLALNQLGYPTLHTYKLYENSDLIDMWTDTVFEPSIKSQKFSMGEPDFDLIPSHGYVGAVDFPIALYFEQLYEKYPDCKFILTERENSEVWFESWTAMFVGAAKTANLGANIFKHVNQLSLYLRWLLSYVSRDQDILLIPPGKPLPIPDKLNSIRSYEEHNRRVREVIPSDRLLVYDVRDGWEPLCQFLNVHQCPDIPFPKTNTKLVIKIQTVSSVLIPASIIILVLLSVFSILFRTSTYKSLKPSISKSWKDAGYFMSTSSRIINRKIEGKSW